MKHSQATRNPYITFLPFLFLYVAVVLFLQNNELWGDEPRHFQQVQNLLHGFFSLPAPHVELRNGPGYPLMLLPFVALHTPLIVLKIFNAFFLYLAVIFLYKALCKLVAEKTALIIAIFFGCYYNALDFIFMLYSEVFTVFLVALLLLLLVKAFRKESERKRDLYIAGFIFGYVALTKIIFGYVLLFMLLVSAFLWIINRSAVNYKKGLVICTMAFVTVLPYLGYTYYLTGRAFYWGTTGGNNLYWMSSLAEDEYGSWFPDPPKQGTGIQLTDKSGEANKGGQMNLKNRTVYITGTEDSLMVHHRKDFEEINKYTGPERDDAYKRIVGKNIKANPVKFIKNCIANVGRILFNYPYSYTPQKPGTLFRLPLNGMIAIMMLFCLVPTLLNWRKINYAVRFVFFIAFLYLGGSVFGSAEIRMFTIVVPLLLCWIAYIAQRSIKLKMKFGDEGN